MMSNPDDMIRLLVKALDAFVANGRQSSNWDIKYNRQRTAFYIADAGYSQESDLKYKAPLAAQAILLEARKYGVRLRWERAAPGVSPMETVWCFHVQHRCPSIQNAVEKYSCGISTKYLIDAMRW